MEMSVYEHIMGLGGSEQPAGTESLVNVRNNSGASIMSPSSAPPKLRGAVKNDRKGGWKIDGESTKGVTAAKGNQKQSRKHPGLARAAAAAAHKTSAAYKSPTVYRPSSDSSHSPQAAIFLIGANGEGRGRGV